MSDNYNNVLIGEYGDVLIDLLIFNHRFSSMNFEEEGQYARVLGLPPIRDVYYTVGSNMILITMDGRLLIVNGRDNKVTPLEFGLPHIKRIYWFGYYAILDETDTLSFIDINISKGTFELLNINPITNVRRIVALDSHNVLVLANNMVVKLMSEQANIQMYNGPIDNLYTGLMVDSNNVVHIMDIGYNYLITVKELYAIDYPIDDCIKDNDSVYSISDGILRELPSTRRIIVTHQEAQGRIISDKNDFTRFIILNSKVAVEDSGGNLYQLPELNPCSLPVRLMDKDKAPLIQQRIMVKNPRTAMRVNY